MRQRAPVYFKLGLKGAFTCKNSSSKVRDCNRLWKYGWWKLVLTFNNFCDVRFSSVWTWCKYCSIWGVVQDATTTISKLLKNLNYPVHKKNFEHLKYFDCTISEMLKSPPPPPPNRKKIIKNPVLSTESVKRIVGGRWREFCFTQPLVWRNLERSAGNRLRRLPNPRPSQLPSALRPVLEKPPPLPPHPPRPD